MRCKYCNERLRQQDYQFDTVLQDWVETGVHADGSCVDNKHVDNMLDPTGYDYLEDFDYGDDSPRL